MKKSLGLAALALTAGLILSGCGNETAKEGKEPVAAAVDQAVVKSMTTEADAIKTAVEKQWLLEAEAQEKEEPGALKALQAEDYYPGYANDAASFATDFDLELKSATNVDISGQGMTVTRVLLEAGDEEKLLVDYSSDEITVYTPGKPAPEVLLVAESVQKAAQDAGFTKGQDGDLQLSEVEPEEGAEPQANDAPKTYAFENVTSFKTVEFTVSADWMVDNRTGDYRYGDDLAVALFNAKGEFVLVHADKVSYWQASVVK